MIEPRTIGTLLCLLLLSSTAASAEEAPAVMGLPDGDLIPIKRVEPQFPREAIINGISGRVVVEGTVGPDGSVIDVKVVESTPPKMFDAATLRAVKQWKFKPRIEGGVAVARPFRQTLQYDLVSGDAPPRQDPLAEFAAAHRATALETYDRMRAFCPDRYAHADDAANAALQLKLDVKRLKAVPHTVEPERQAAADAWNLRQVEACLFSSWEQLRDPQAFELAAWFASRGGEGGVELGDALKAHSLGMAEAPAATPTPQQFLKVRSWLFKRWVTAYYELINAQAAQFPPAKARSLATSDALARAKALVDLLKPKDARSTLARALKKTEDPVDRGLLLMALARVQAGLGDIDDAIASLEMAVTPAGQPWNLVQTAEMARATLCGRSGKTECFDAAVSKLNAELGLTDKFKL